MRECISQTKVAKIDNDSKQTKNKSGEIFLWIIFLQKTSRNEGKSETNRSLKVLVVFRKCRWQKGGAIWHVKSVKIDVAVENCVFSGKAFAIKAKFVKRLIKCHQVKSETTRKIVVQRYWSHQQQKLREKRNGILPPSRRKWRPRPRIWILFHFGWFREEN